MLVLQMVLHGAGRGVVGQDLGAVLALDLMKEILDFYFAIYIYCLELSQKLVNYYGR